MIAPDARQCERGIDWLIEQALQHYIMAVTKGIAVVVAGYVSVVDDTCLKDSANRQARMKHNPTADLIVRVWDEGALEDRGSRGSAGGDDYERRSNRHGPRANRIRKRARNRIAHGRYYAGYCRGIARRFNLQTICGAVMN